MTSASEHHAPIPVLLCRSNTRLCALPLAHVLETMRALPADPLPDLPPFLLGVSMIRGAAVPVVALARLLGAAGPGAPGRYVTLRLGQRQVALAVDAVLGVRSMAGAELAAIAPLLHDADAGMVEAIATVDSELMLVLAAARLVPDEVWQALDARERGA